MRRGKLEMADHGTLFLDEIGDLHSNSQAKLLRVLQTGTFDRVGGSETVVEVSGAAVQIDTTTETTQTNITEDVVQNVPHGRSFQSVIQFAPSARNEPRNCVIVDTFEVFPHAGVNRAPLDFDDLLKVLPGDDDRNGGDVHDDLAVEQAVARVGPNRLKRSQDDLFLVDRLRVSRPYDAEFDFASKHRIF